MTLVSVIIPTFNRAGSVGRAVSSILYQTHGDYEIIVVDDGSTDQTQDVLAQFRGRITPIRHQENRGVSAARNTGIRSSGAHSGEITKSRAAVVHRSATSYSRWWCS